MKGEVEQLKQAKRADTVIVLHELRQQTPTFQHITNIFDCLSLFDQTIITIRCRYDRMGNN